MQSGATRLCTMALSTAIGLVRVKRVNSGRGDSAWPIQRLAKWIADDPLKPG